VATFKERTALVLDCLSDAADELASGLETGATVGVYLGIGRPVPDKYAVFVTRWNDPELSLVAFQQGQRQDGISDYRIIVQVRCLGAEAAADASEALDTIGENVCSIMQAFAAVSGYWFNGQLIRSAADVRPNITAPYTSVNAGEFWQTETWTFRVQYRVTRT